MNAKIVSKSLILLVVLICACGALTSVLGQTGGGGTIQGTIADPGGAVVPGANVVAINVASAVETVGVESPGTGDPAADRERRIES
jgi:hypothetical protein